MLKQLCPLHYSCEKCAAESEMTSVPRRCALENSSWNQETTTMAKNHHGATEKLKSVSIIKSLPGA